MRLQQSKYFILALLLLLGDVRASAKESGGQEKQNYHSISRYISSLHRSGQSIATARGTIAFFIRFVDFGCTVCFNNFLEFCGSLKRSGVIHHEDVLLIVLRDGSSERRQRFMVKKWAGANDLPFPVFLATEEIFDSCSIGHSSVVVLSRLGEVDLAEELPLSGDVARMILSHVSGK